MARAGRPRARRAISGHRVDELAEQVLPGGGSDAAARRVIGQAAADVATKPVTDRHSFKGRPDRARCQRSFARRPARRAPASARRSRPTRARARGPLRGPPRTNCRIPACNQVRQRVEFARRSQSRDCRDGDREARAAFRRPWDADRGGTTDVQPADRHAHPGRVPQRGRGAACCGVRRHRWRSPTALRVANARARRGARAAARRARGVHLRRADAELPRRRRHERPLPRRDARGGAARAMARLPRDGGRDRRPRRSRSPTAASARSARTSSTWACSARCSPASLIRPPCAILPQTARRVPRARRRSVAWLAVMIGAAATSVELAVSGHRAARHRAAGDARRARADRRSARP